MADNPRYLESAVAASKNCPHFATAVTIEGVLRWALPPTFTERRGQNTDIQSLSPSATCPNPETSHAEHRGCVGIRPATPLPLRWTADSIVLPTGGSGRAIVKHHGTTRLMADAELGNQRA
jgi:hypothetical protein